jgi:hypothetical protein
MATYIAKKITFIQISQGFQNKALNVIAHMSKYIIRVNPNPDP